MNEFTIIMGGVAMKAMLAALFTGDEEEEPMTVNGDRDKPNKFRKSEGEKAKRKVFANLIENYSTRIIDDITLYYNPHAAYNTLKVDGVGRLMEQTTAMIMAIYQGDGEKFDKNMKGATLPSVVRGWGGFKPLTEMEYENNELLDQIFKSDLKKEMNDLRKKRANITEEMTEDLREQYNYDDLSPAAQLKVDARIKKRIKKAKEKLLRTPDRRLFDEDQNRIK